MHDYTIWAFATNMAYFLITLAVLRLILWWLDRSLGVRFKADVWDPMARSPVALAVYHGARLLAVCIVAAAFL